MNTLLITFNLLGGLAIFLFGMKIMSDGLQKMAGVKMRQWLAKATTNRLSATLSGMLVTSVIQSSSATTVMVVGFTSAGLLTLYQALGVIFGANIGTTLTAWVVSLFGFKIQISLFALPVIALGFFGQFLPRKWVIFRRIAEAAVGFGLLFLGLDIMKNTIPADFAQTPWVTQWLSQFTPDTFISLLLLILTGTVLTVILQSSSAVMAMTLTCAAAGIINFSTACALVLGENIGTTITANLAALGAPKNARRAALGHFLFNLFGVIWVSLLFQPFIHLIDWLIPGNPSITTPGQLSSVLPYHISAFHSMFNVLNTLLMLPLLKQLAALTFVIIPKNKREDKEKDNELVYLNARFTQTPELAILAARKESERMLKFVSKQTDKIIYALKTDDQKLFERLLQDVQEYERTTDILEHKINSFLTQSTHGNLSRHAIAQTVALFDLTSSIESMADYAEKIALLLGKFLHTQPVTFTKQDIDTLEQMAKLCKDALKLSRRALPYFPNITAADAEQTASILQHARDKETQLNTLRQHLRDARNLRISKGEKVSANSITAYGDILNNFECIGDHALRLTEQALYWKTLAKHQVLIPAQSAASTGENK